MFTLEIVDTFGVIKEAYRDQPAIMFKDIVENKPKIEVTQITDLVALVEWDSTGNPTVSRYLGVLYR